MALRTNAIGHGGGENGKTSDELLRIIRSFHAERIAALAKKLDAVKEGDGTVLDNTLIVYLSDSAEDHHDSCYEWPLLMLGNLGGRLKAGDRFLNVPGYHSSANHRTMAQFYTALLHAAGAPVEHFGIKDRKLIAMGNTQDGPWTDILS
jgi:hypothetical protein